MRPYHLDTNCESARGIVILTIYAPYSSSRRGFPSFRGLPPSLSRVSTFGVSEAVIHSLCSWGRPGKVVPADGQASDLPLGQRTEPFASPCQVASSGGAGEGASFKTIPFQSGPAGSALNSPALVGGDLRWEWGVHPPLERSPPRLGRVDSVESSRSSDSRMMTFRVHLHVARQISRVQSTWTGHYGRLRSKSGEMSGKELFLRSDLDFAEGINAW